MNVYILFGLAFYIKKYLLSPYNYQINRWEKNRVESDSLMGQKPYAWNTKDYTLVLILRVFNTLVIHILLGFQ